MPVHEPLASYTFDALPKVHKCGSMTNFPNLGCLFHGGKTEGSSLLDPKQSSRSVAAKDYEDT